MRTTTGNKEVPLTFFYNSPCSRKYVLIRLAPYPKQHSISQFCDITKRLLYIRRPTAGSLGLQVSVEVAKFLGLVVGRAGQVRKLVSKSANPQLRTNEKSCGHADLRTLAV